MSLSRDNRRRLNKAFPEANRSEARAALEAAALDDRVARAVIYLAAGDLELLSHYINQAQLDYRDCCIGLSTTRTTNLDASS